jgi:hypothetical protein
MDAATGMYSVRRYVLLYVARYLLGSGIVN